MADEPGAHDSVLPPKSDATVQTVTPRILVFYDYACQFCYLDWPRLKRLRAEYGAELFLVPFELRPELAPGGVSLETLGAAHSERVVEHMRRLAGEGALDLVFPGFVPNTHLSLALGEYGRDMGAAEHERVHEALFVAYNGRGADIGSRDVVLGIAEESGLDVNDVASALDEGRFDERLHQFHHLALSLGITATPAALICNEILIGSRPYRVLSDALERCLVDEDSIESRERLGRAHHHVDSGVAIEEGEPPSIVV